MLQLRSTDGDGQVLVFPLAKARTTIGRDPSNDIVLSDTDVSRWHALLLNEDNRLQVRDMESTNGVYVNNVRSYDQVALQVGDILILGSNLFAVGEEPDLDEDDLGQTVMITGGQLSTANGNAKKTHGYHEPAGTPDSFDKTVVRDKFDMLEGAFEKKTQVARFARLECRLDDGGDRCYLLAMPTFRIGRNADAHLRIADTHLSGEHAEIRLSERGAELFDLQSDNGTKVNDKRIANHLLVEGDVITVPGAKLVYRHNVGLRGRFTDFLKSVLRR
jgi:pSer/pThr/pTyr-binding forkhead associated (FHA) protein